REARGLPLFGYDQGDRLSVEFDFVIVERTERRALVRSHVILVGLVGACHFRPVLVRQHVDDAFDGKRATGVDARDAALRNGGGDDAAISETGDVELAGILSRAGDLGPAVDAG